VWRVPRVVRQARLSYAPVGGTPQIAGTPAALRAQRSDVLRLFVIEMVTCLPIFEPVEA
jgi:hypothetical protein